MADIEYNVDVLPTVYTPAPGPPGPSGASAYAVAVAHGFVGTEAAWLTSLEGDSAYEVALENGYSGTEAAWLVSLEGDSAYQVAVNNGYTGSETAWLASLIGPPGASAYQIWLQNGNSGTETAFLNSLVGKQGPSGDSAYTIAVHHGFVGTESQWLASLQGPSGSTTWSAITGKPTVFPPSPHTHAETDVTNLVADLNNRALISTTVTGSKSLTGGGGLSGALTLSFVNDVADPGASHFYATSLSDVRGWIPYGTAALVNVPASGNATNAQAVLGSDTRLADSRSPKVHAASHGSGGSDQVAILRAQISDLPGLVTTTSMGFVPQLPTANPTTLYFRGDGTYAAVTATVTSVPWSAIIGAPLATIGAPGLLRQLNPLTPIPGSGSQAQVWCRGDDTWQTLPVTTYTSAAFNLPAIGASATVAINPNPEWPQITSCIYFSDGTTRGFLECSGSGPGPFTTVTLTNRGFLLNAAPGTLVNTGAIISLKGPSVTGAGLSGLVPTLPAATPSARFLDGTGTFNLLPAATVSAPGVIPILPVTSGAGSQTKVFLRGDNSWQSLPEVSYLSAGFTVPAVGSSVTVQFYSPFPGWPNVGIGTVYFSDGTYRGFLGIVSYVAGTGQLTLVNRGNATAGNTPAADCLMRLVGPGVVSATNAGLVPTPPNNTSTYLRGDGTFAIVPVATATASGLVPTPPNNTTTYLRGDGTFAIVPVATATASGLVPTPPNNTTTYLRGDGTFAAAPAPPAGGAGSPGVLPTSDVQVFTSAGLFTWTKPTTGTPTSVEIICIGGGGGGGGGAYVAAATAGGGGGGGGGGSYSSIIIPATLLGPNAQGNVGIGGTGGTAVSVSGTAGNPGQAYAAATHDSWFGSNTPGGANICYADGGRPGGGGGNTGTAGTAGTGGVKGQYAGTAGGAGSASGAAAGAATAPTSVNGAGGGGGGGGFSTGNAEVAGALGATYPTWLGGIGAGAAGAVHTAGGTASTVPFSAYLPGAGGGGGGSSNTAATRGGAGGVPSNYGGGGGGGGAGDANANAVGAGAGAAGAWGCVIVITYF